MDVDVAPSTPGAEPDFDEIDADLIDELMRDDPVEDPQYGMDIDLLLSLGVEPADACKIINGAMRKVAPVTFMEAYGRGGLSDAAKCNPLGAKGLHALDFACKKPNGVHWDFSLASVRREAMQLVESADPDWIVG